MSTLAVIWRAAGLTFATSVDAVVEVLPPLACRPAPAVPSWVRGLFSHRGRLTPLIDVAGLMGREPPADRMANRVLVVRCARDESNTPWAAGLWVENIVEVERIDFDAAGSHPGFASESGRFLGPVVESRWGAVQQVAPYELFTPQQTALLSERIREASE